MKLYIKQKVFALNEKFTVKNESGSDIFTVEGSFMRIPKRFTIHNEAGADVAVIEKKLLTLLPKYVISVGGTGSFEIIKNFTLLNQKYTVSNIGWSISGDFFAHDYCISKGRSTIANISKKWFTWGDSYEINVPNEHDALLALCVVICIDHCCEDSDSANHANF